MRRMDIRELLGYCAGNGTERVEGSNLNGWAGLVREGIHTKNNPELYVVRFGGKFVKDGTDQDADAFVCRGPLGDIDLTQASENGAGSLYVILKSSRYATLFVDGGVTPGTSGTHVFTSYDPYEKPYEFYLSSDDAVEVLSNSDLQEGKISEMMDGVQSEENLSP